MVVTFFHEAIVVNQRIPFFCMFLIFYSGIMFSVRGDEIDREIAQLKKELSRVKGQRKDENVQAAKEKTEFAAYKKRTSNKIDGLKHQTDSLQVQIDQMTRKGDSLNIGLTSLQQKMREQELIREQLRKAILAAAGSVGEEIQRMPPLVKDQYRSPLQYLSSEITAGSVETTEALFRLMRIIQDARAVCREIQVVEGASPVPQLRGTVYRLRIGAIFEAIVDVQGTKAYLWNDSLQDSSGIWRQIDDQEIVTSLHKAILMREGKSVPELVRLPINGQRRDGNHE
jgi:hypothetical protein